MISFKPALFVSMVLFLSQPVLALMDPSGISTSEEAEKIIDDLSLKIEKSPGEAELYISRGDTYFLIHEFDSAEEDYSKALSINDDLDAAYYGRGMTRGRQGFVKEGIADLSVFIKRNPDSSLAYTKRGVRYIWLGDKENAFKDLSKAIKLNPDNAEAHDDLGVVLAQKGEFTKAIEHFRTTVTLDPTYQKGYHNLAIALFITGNDSSALISVNNSLSLAPNFRDSMLLKANILEAMGMVDEAVQLKEDAEFLPQSGDWTEHAPLQ
ncbi:MAG: tetratricopeptide repeat protein [Arenicellales bacterium]